MTDIIMNGQAGEFTVNIIYCKMTRAFRWLDKEGGGGGEEIKIWKKVTIFITYIFTDIIHQL